MKSLISESFRTSTHTCGLWHLASHNRRPRNSPCQPRSHNPLTPCGCEKLKSTDASVDKSFNDKRKRKKGEQNLLSHKKRKDGDSPKQAGPPPAMLGTGYGGCRASAMSPQSTRDYES